MLKQVKVFGERNTGTNYISDMILQNFPVKILSDGPPYWWEKRFGLSPASMSSYFFLSEWKNLGWKHAAPRLTEKQAQNRYFVLVTKNPYSWLLSLHKRPYHNWEAQELSFSEFLQTPWPLMRCDGVDASSVTPIELWNIKNRSYAHLADAVDFSLLITYEGILEDPVEFIHAMSTLIGCPLKEEVKLQSKGSKSTDKDRTFNQYQDYYLNERWKEKFSIEDIAYVNERLDANLAAQLGYSLL